jgi:chitodextrinase
MMSKRRFVGAVGAVVMLAGIVAGSAGAVPALTMLWTAGGLDASSITGAGQAARIASDSAGNVAVVSGPTAGRDLAVTSYSSTGALRWRRTVTTALGTFQGDWVAAARNGDFVVVGHTVNSSGSRLASTMARFASDGTFQWRVDFAPPFFPSTARLLVDSAGNEYLASSAVGTGLFVQKYSPSGALLWSQQDATTGGGFAVATSLALGPNGADVIVTGTVSGSAVWITASYNASTGARNWLASAPEGTAARDVVVDATRVYVTGQGVTGGGTPSIRYWLTVVAYDRATGARLWRTDKMAADGTDGAGLRMALAPDGSVVVAGQTSRGFLDWYTVDLATNGTVRWETVRDGGLNTNEVPADVLVLADGTTVVTGVGGPNLPGGFIQGVTAGYSASGTLLWEAFSRMATVWATGLPSGDVCATGGYDALITCWRPSAVAVNLPPTAVLSATPTTGVAPLAVSFNGSASTDPDGTVTSWAWSFGDGASGTGAQTTHVYSTPGTYAATLTVTDNGGASGTATRSVVVTASLPRPSAPTSLTATALSRSSIGLTWTNGAISQTQVRVERCTGLGCKAFVQVATLAGTATTFTDTGLARATTYTYRVRARNAAGFSAYSNTVATRTRNG